MSKIIKVEKCGAHCPISRECSTMNFWKPRKENIPKKCPLPDDNTTSLEAELAELKAWKERALDLINYLSKVAS